MQPLLRSLLQPVLSPLINAIRSGFSVRQLFSAGEQGLWYDPSDFSTLFQDSAGTTPVTAVEQPVGLILDKSGSGDHSKQATSASRPVLSARVNLLTYSEDFSNAAWGKSNATIGPNAIAAPDGTLTADRLIESAVNAIHEIQAPGSPVTTPINSTFTLSCCAKAGERSFIRLSDDSDSAWDASFNLATGVVASFGASTVASISSMGDGWYACSITYTNTTTQTRTRIRLALSTGQTAYLGDGASGAYIWGAQLETGSTATRYQSITTATSYDTVGFKQYLKFDGVDDNEATTTGGGATTAFFWCSSIKAGKIGAAQTLFSDTGTDTGYRVRINASNQLELAAGNATAYTMATSVATLAVGQTVVLTAWDDGVNLNVQIDNGAVASVARPAVSAGTAAITIGKDNGAASSFFLGSIYEKIYVKDDVQTAAQIASAKAFCASKAGVTL